MASYGLKDSGFRVLGLNRPQSAPAPNVLVGYGTGLQSR